MSYYIMVQVETFEYYAYFAYATNHIKFSSFLDTKLDSIPLFIETMKILSCIRNCKINTVILTAHYN